MSVPVCKDTASARTSTWGAASSLSPSLRLVPALSATEAVGASTLPRASALPASSRTLPVPAAMMLPCVRPTPVPVLMPMSRPACASRLPAACTSPRRFRSWLAVSEAPPLPALSTLPALKVMEPVLTPMYTLAVVPLCTRPKAETFKVKLARKHWSPPATAAAATEMSSPTRVMSSPAVVVAATEMKLADALMSSPALVAAAKEIEPKVGSADAVMSPARASVATDTMMSLAVKLMSWPTSTAAEMLKSVSATIDKEPLFVTVMPLWLRTKVLSKALAPTTWKLWFCKLATVSPLTREPSSLCTRLAPSAPANTVSSDTETRSGLAAEPAPTPAITNKASARTSTAEVLPRMELPACSTTLPLAAWRVSNVRSTPACTQALPRVLVTSPAKSMAWAA